MVRQKKLYYRRPPKNLILPYIGQNASLYSTGQKNYDTKLGFRHSNDHLSS